MSEKVKKLCSECFDSAIAEDKVTLVDFFATWCGPCKMLAPTIEAVAEAVGDTANVAKIDVDEAEDVAERYGIMSVPTLMFFRNGELKEKAVGLRSKEDIISMIKNINTEA